jgi:predicted ATPase/DNA-binding SARP family transcriptional activator
MARLLLFGSPTLESGGESSALPCERRSQLLVFLALRRAWVTRPELAAMFWPGHDGRHAQANVRKTLFRLQEMPRAVAIETQGGALRAEIETDVAAFEAALREGRLQDALALRRGELLAGFEDDANDSWSGWLGFERDRLRAAWRGAALERLAGDIDPSEGAELSTRLLEADPLDEAAMGEHLKWLARGGQGARARHAYREFAERLGRELGLAPGTGLKAMHDSIVASPSAAAAMAPPAPRPPDDGFVGRAVELRRIATLLGQEGCRLLCLVGPGGVGKTRLARRAMRDLAPGYPDGVAFVPLEDLAAAGELAARIAREAGHTLAGSRDPLQQLADFLRDRRMLLVLDNFEHLATESPVLESLLEECPGLAVIVTSRVRLAAFHEWLLPLDGLPCPEPEDEDRLEAFDAARLFVQAARRVEPRLASAAEAAAIVEICRLVEGLPLALELAASWTRVLPCDAIAAELRHGTGLLQAAGTARPSRHAGIDVVFDQSWRLLGEAERDALSRLSVFRGGFSADSARAVAGASLPVLGALADKSLLRKDGARLSMHPLVQQLAALRLGGDVREAARRAHAHHFRRLLVQLRRPVENGDREGLRQLEVEYENCRGAWHWAIGCDDAATLADCVPTLRHYWDHRVAFREGLALLAGALQSQASRADPRLEAALLGGMAHLEYRLDRYAAAEASATRGLAPARAARDHGSQALCLQVLGTCCYRQGRYGEARRYFRQALRQATADNDPRKAAVMLYNEAVVEKATGRYAEALRLFVESLAQYRRLGDVAGEALCLNSLGSLHLDRAEHEEAGTHLRAGLAVCDRHGLAGPRVFVLSNLAEHSLKTGDDDAAMAHAERAIGIAEPAGNRVIASAMKLVLARLALRRRDLPAARARLAESLDLATAIGNPLLQVEAVSFLAELLEAQGEPDCARLVLDFAAGHPSASAALRDAIRTRQGPARAAGGGRRAWPGLSLGELAHGIVAEAGTGHAALVARLKAGA